MCSGYQYSVFHPENTGYFFNYDLVIAIYLKYINLMGGGGGGGGEKRGACAHHFFEWGGGGNVMFVPPFLTPHFYFPLVLYVYITLTNNYLAFFIYQLIILWTISIN